MSTVDYLKFGKRLFKKRGASPLYLVFFVTDRCNAKCKHCLLADGVHKPDKSTELTLHEIEMLTHRMDPLLFLLPTGGEPFLRDDLGEIIKLFYSNTKVRNVGIPTNGFFTAKIVSVIKDLLDTCPDLDLGVDVSLDGIKEKHDEIRGVKGLFDKAVETFNELRILERMYPRFNVNIETTVSSYNDEHLVENYDYFTNVLKAHTVFTLLTRDKPRDPASKFFTIDRYEQYAMIMEEGIKKGLLTGYISFPFSDFINAKRIVRHRLIAKVVRENKYQIPCYAGVLGAAIFANGDVYPCELHTDLVLGNLRDFNFDFKAIWKNEKAEKARAAIQCGKCFCTYECFLTINILFNPLMMPRILKEWGSLKWSRFVNRWRKEEEC
jgi:radical SAM protein with 4Fe4S-binding SPASM domain